MSTHFAHITPGLEAELAYHRERLTTEAEHARLRRAARGPRVGILARLRGSRVA